MTRDSLRSRVSMVASDEFASFMWIRVRGLAPLYGDIDIAICYFRLASSQFAIHSDSVEDPYLDSYASITQYSAIGDIILLGDFNARTKALHIPLHDSFEDAFCIPRDSSEWNFIDCRTVFGAYYSLWNKPLQAWGISRTVDPEPPSPSLITGWSSIYIDICFAAPSLGEYPCPFSSFHLSASWTLVPHHPS